MGPYREAEWKIMSAQCTCMTRMIQTCNLVGAALSLSLEEPCWSYSLSLEEISRDVSSVCKDAECIVFSALPKPIASAEL